MQKEFADQLLDFGSQRAGRIAEAWYKDVSTNSRTTGYRFIPPEACLRHAMAMYSHLAEMCFAEDSYEAVEKVLDAEGFAEDHFARGVALDEVLYAVTLLRRHLWFSAEKEAADSDVTDYYHGIDSINRVLLVFDYGTHIITRKYHEMAVKTHMLQHPLNVSR